VRRSAVLALLVGGALALAACQGPPAPLPPAAGPTLASQAADALALGDYARAADLYRRALLGAPDSLPLHYGLAVAASHLNLKDEALREFKWVLARGPKGSPEVEAARRWLASAGALTGAEPAETPADEPPTGPGLATLEGQMVLPEGGQNPPQRRMVILYGLPNTATKDERYQGRTDDNGRFRLPNLLPGPYMVTDAVSGARNWRLRIELQPGQAATLDLTPANHIKAKDDFPTRG
jgi:tetratricopeptide (TPR) repeat protein